MKILLVSSSSPWPATRGGNQRTNLFYRSLSKLGSVDLLLVSSPDKISDDEKTVLEREFNLLGIVDEYDPIAQWPWRLLAKEKSGLIARLAHNLSGYKNRYQAHDPIESIVLKLHRAKHYDLFAGRYLLPSSQAGLLNFPNSIIDVDDLDTQKYVSRLNSTNTSTMAKFWIHWHHWRLNRVIPQALRKAGYLWVTNANDQKKLQEYGCSSIGVLPNIPYIHEEYGKLPLPPNRESQVILAVCSMQMSFNLRGVEHFLAHLWPTILQRNTSAQFLLVGSKMSQDQIDTWGSIPGVTALGFVDNLIDVYQKCAFTITPVSDGGGSKIKVGESLLLGRAAVITSHALRGYENILSHRESVMVAQDDREFIEHSLELLSDPDLRDSLALNGHERIQQNLSFDAFSETVQSAIEQHSPSWLPRAPETVDS